MASTRTSLLAWWVVLCSGRLVLVRRSKAAMTRWEAVGGVAGTGSGSGGSEFTGRPFLGGRESPLCTVGAGEPQSTAGLPASDTSTCMTETLGGSRFRRHLFLFLCGFWFWVVF